MSSIDSDGMVLDTRVLPRRFVNIEQGPMAAIKAIVVHQTDTTTATQAFNSYVEGPNGAHFLIDEFGQIFQTASLRQRCYHVGQHIKSKCLAVDKSTCDTATMAAIKAMQWGAQVDALNRHERTKQYPDRYPLNSDSIGIEIVGPHIDRTHYRPVTAPQNESLKWLVAELYHLLNLSDADVYRHPDVSYKNPGEAASAIWK